jgi:hypothetical protein
MELEITWNRIWRVWWALVWRNLIMIVIACAVGAILGFVIGLFMGMMGFTLRTIQFVTAPLGFATGLILSVVPIKLILGKDFGEFRLVLLAGHTLEATVDPKAEAIR